MKNIWSRDETVAVWPRLSSDPFRNPRRIGLPREKNVKCNCTLVYIKSLRRDVSWQLEQTISKSNVKELHFFQKDWKFFGN